MFATTTRVRQDDASEDYLLTRRSPEGCHTHKWDGLHIVAKHTITGDIRERSLLRHTKNSGTR